MNGRQRWLHAPVVKCVPIDDVSIAVVDEVVVALREWSGTSKSVQCENATNIWTTSGNRRVRKRLVQHMQTNVKSNAYLAILSVFPLLTHCIECHDVMHPLALQYEKEREGLFSTIQQNICSTKWQQQNKVEGYRKGTRPILAGHPLQKI